MGGRSWANYLENEGGCWVLERPESADAELRIVRGNGLSVEGEREQEEDDKGEMGVKE